MKMKLPFAVLFFATLLLSAAKQDELQAVEATYEGQSGGYFFFMDMEGSNYAFQDIEPTAGEKYDLTDGSCEGKKVYGRYIV